MFFLVWTKGILPCTVGPWNDISDKIKHEFKLPSLLPSNDCLWEKKIVLKKMYCYVFLSHFGELCVVTAAAGVVGWRQRSISAFKPNSCPRCEHKQAVCACRC